MSKLKCPESIEELEELDRLIPLCRKDLYAQAKAKIESGAACSLRDASIKLGAELDRNPESIRKSIQREQKIGTLSQLTREYTPKTEYQKTIIKEYEGEKKEVRKARQQEIKNNLTSIELPQSKFQIIYADPPWKYEFSETTTREIENQYPTMALIEIKDLPVPDICFDDCILFLWATSPKLQEAMSVLEAWGFEYKTCAIWDKQKIGMGYYFRQQHEILLIGKRRIPLPMKSGPIQTRLRPEPAAPDAI